MQYTQEQIMEAGLKELLRLQKKCKCKTKTLINGMLICNECKKQTKPIIYNKIKPIDFNVKKVCILQH